MDVWSLRSHEAGGCDQPEGPWRARHAAARQAVVRLSVWIEQTQSVSEQWCINSLCNGDVSGVRYARKLASGGVSRIVKAQGKI
jgi:hypothetical protein